jgi:hypothetical protein
MYCCMKKVKSWVSIVYFNSTINQNWIGVFKYTMWATGLRLIYPPFAETSFSSGIYSVLGKLHSLKENEMYVPI